MQIAGYTFLENQCDYNEFVEDLEELVTQKKH